MQCENVFFHRWHYELHFYLLVLFPDIQTYLHFEMYLNYLLHRVRPAFDFAAL
jgi:hypothetical protein